MSAAAPGMVAGYGFSELSGSTTADASGNNNTGALEGGVTWTTGGKYGNALSFDGAGVVRILDSPSWRVNGLTGYTVSAWVKVKDVAVSYKAVIGIGSWPADDIHIYKNGSAWVYGFRTAGGPNGWSCNGFTSALSYLSSVDDTYHHIALVLNSAEGRCDFYSDGQIVGTDLYVDGATGFRTGAEYSNLFVGGLNSGQGLNADIDEVRVYTRALSQGEIQTDMDAAVGDTTPPVISAVTATNIGAATATVT
ncbi:MAG: LamG-like jellyroll fold domain-containing protein, partial [Blastocatellia bacterium]